ncbi:sigma-70 family RNA polymerase sigma factor [Parapedobacter sp. ISTM3]|uniref:RNA polymerase sigma factor n=1 Tax=Parapedobacter sp. ISTM3 TaxID=2800130 RepID=UPI001905F8D4|nr:sigma-70 family RNA polymerase sigma factor [Parapedobacter sp. ISTM3]MBK1439539.1 sigma-70 family RNA polymerase sigma factor [Parapedobacter sp. ISTM3]
MSRPEDHTTPHATPKGIGAEEFEQLYRAHWKAVFAVCYRYVRDVDSAADLAQHVFELAWRKRSMLVAGSDIGKYLCRAAKLEAQSHCRHASHRKQLLEMHSCTLSGATNNTEDDVFFRELTRTVASLASTLPAKSREVYLLHEDGLDKRGIAASMAISEKNVEYHLYKALGYLRERLRRIH